MSVGVIRPCHHTNYDKVQNQAGLEAVWARLAAPERLQRGELQAISAETRIPTNTLKSWRKKLRKDPSYRPHYGLPGRSKVLNPEIEREIYDVIHDQYIREHRYCPRCGLAEIARRVVGDRVPNFRAGHSWVKGFLKRWGLSARSPHVRRRSAPADEVVARFLAEFELALSQFPRRLIFNMDESAWRIVNGRLKTIARKGDDEVIVDSKASMKETLTVIATIDADGGKYPIWVIAKGKTAKCEEKFRNDIRLRHFIRAGKLIVGHSEKGWATADLMKGYLKWLDREVTEERLKYLLWDLHSSHRDEAVKSCARQLNTHLSFIPAGQTAMWQPLDRRIFGHVKMVCHASFERMMLDHGLDQVDIIDAIVILLNTWSEVPASAIKESWEILTGRLAAAPRDPEEDYDAEYDSDDSDYDGYYDVDDDYYLETEGTNRQRFPHV